MRRLTTALLAALAISAGLLTAASGSVRHPTEVSTDPADFTPSVVETPAVTNPHVDAIAVAGVRVFAGGLFEAVTGQDGTEYARTNIVAFTTAGVVSTRFNPQIAGGQVWALTTDPATNSVYVGGDFTSLGGVSGTLFKLNATTGAIDAAFRPAFKTGRVNELRIVTIGGVKRLFVGGSFAQKLIALNPATGANTRYFDETIADPLPGAWGNVSVQDFAVDPSNTHLVATGNFQTVNATARSKFFMLDLASTGATLNPWYYPGFAKPCSSQSPRRIAYLQGIDWSPDGSAFSVAATGQIPVRKADIWYERLGDANLPNTTVCDGVGRFSLADATKPEWINYTGGDSVWSVADTGAAVYVQGHFKWVDNPDGRASQGVGDATSGRPASSRTGIAAISPETGLALSWNPGLRAMSGGKALLGVRNGLWVGSDSPRFGTEPRYGIAFAPLP